MSNQPDPTPIEPTSAPGNPDEPQILEADENLSETDSAFGSDGSSTAASASITSSILNYEYSNGRRYNGYRKGSYMLPNDETEQDRLDLMHHVFLVLLDGKLHRAPIPANPQRALDVGTGTGLWAIDFADEYPSAEVTGTDISPIQPSWVPPNVKFYVDDLENEWVYSPEEAFDFVHARNLGGSVNNWDKFIGETFQHTKPGGWLELVEFEFEALLNSGEPLKTEAPYVFQFQEKCNEAGQKFGKELDLVLTHKKRLIDAGYVDVKDDVYAIPVGPWPKDPKLKEAGRFFQEHMVMGIEAYTIGFMGKVLNWSDEECQVLIAKANAEIRNPKVHMYVRCHFVYGKKPAAAASSTA